jgi:Uma2 family endonuclease
MSTTHTTPPPVAVDYPDGDGRPVAETPLHRDNLLGTIDMLRRHFAGDPMVYVSGKMFVYYVHGDRLRALAPDVFVVRGVPDRQRRVYKTWEEGRGPDVVIEMTSRSTREEDLEDKFALYRDTLHVAEYFLFDPESEYLDPPLQGYRLTEGRYEPIEPVEGRLPSEVLGLHLQSIGQILRLYDPAAGRIVPTWQESALEAEAALRAAAEENERLRRELEALRRPPAAGP